MNINNPTTFSTPALVYSTSNSSGSAGALRADDTLAVFSTTVPTNIAVTTVSASTGDNAFTSREDHVHGSTAITAAASEAEMVAASSTTVYASPGRTVNHPGVAKAWLQMVYSGGTPTEVGSYNVASFSDLGVGIYKAVWDIDMSDTTYSVVGVCRTDNTTSDVLTVSSAAETGINVSLHRDGTKTDLPSMLVAFGTQ